jgi:hypothetical protein
MNAGRELDALVAEKVMGWTSDLYAHSLMGEKVRLWLPPPPSDVAHTADTLPRYSTDIAAAWEVVEKVSGPGLAFELVDVGSFNPGYTELPRWCASFGDGNVVIAEEADTAPHAICLAALKAVGA